MTKPNTTPNALVPLKKTEEYSLAQKPTAETNTSTLPRNIRSVKQEMNKREKNDQELEEDALLNDSLNLKNRGISHPKSIKHLSSSKKSNLTNPYEPLTPNNQMTPISITGSKHDVSSVSPIKGGHKIINLSVQDHYNFNSQEVPESALKSPTMLSSVLDERNAAKKRAIKHNPNLNFSMDLNSPRLQRNPFKFIEQAIKEAK